VPDITDLETFVAVAETGGVSAAARRLGLPKSIVSRRLVRLENELGTQLLARTTRGAALTEAGSTFHEHAARVCAEMEAACESLAPNGEARGLLRVAAPLSFGPTQIAPVLAELARRNPQLQVHAVYSDRFADLVGEGFDAAIRVGTLPDSSLVARRIGPVYGKVVASPAYLETHGAPKTPSDLLAHEALMQGTEVWRLLDSGKVVVVHPRGRFKADNGQALAAAAVAGLGLAILPDFLIDEHIASGALVAVLTNYPVPEAGIFVVRPPGIHPPRKVKLLTELLVERFGGPESRTAKKRGRS
jgi:DNA-binding transcriptional LysR family regulator